MAQKYFKANHLKLENLRVARGWSREQLASKAIVSTRTLDSIMAGKQAVLSTFSKLAKALESPVNTIIADFEQPQPRGERRYTVTITISAPYNDYDETKDLPEFLTKLLSRVGGDEIWGAEVSAGSTQIRFYLAKEQHTKLISEFSAGNLGDLDIVGMTIDWKPYDSRESDPTADAVNLWDDMELEASEPGSDAEDKG